MKTKNIYGAVLMTLFGLLQPLNTWALEKPIYIMHTNDIHCGVEDNIGLAKVAAYKKALLKESPNVVLVDAGDAIQGAPLGKLSDGEAIVNIMNAVGYDFLIPGNHEFDYGMEAFLKQAKKAKSGYYCANLLDLRTGKQVFPGYKVMNFEDTKVAFVGATTPSALSSSTPKFFQDQNGKWIYSFYEDEKGKKLYRQLQKNIDAARQEGAKYVFIVGHLGLNGVKKEWSSNYVAKKVKGIIGIIDGHSHETYNRYELGSKGSVVTQTGTKLNNVGLIVINPDGSVEMNMDSRFNLRQKPDEAVNNVIKAEKQKIAKVLNANVCHSSVKLFADDPATGKRLVRSQNSNLGDFVADAFRFTTGADVAVVNGGGLRKNIPAGNVTYNNLLEAMPFGNMMCTKRVTGQQLLDCLEMGARQLPYESGAFMHISGGSYTIDTRIPSSVQIDATGTFIGVKGDYRVKDVMINGQPLDVKKQYVLGGIAYTLKNGGDGISVFRNCELLQDEAFSDFDCISEYITKKLNGTIGQEYANPYGEGRIKIIK